MGKIFFVTVLAACLLVFQGSVLDSGKKSKLTSRKVLVTFFSKTEDENIRANN
jgi:hypothetical protein